MERFGNYYKGPMTANDARVTFVQTTEPGTSTVGPLTPTPFSDLPQPGSPDWAPPDLDGEAP
jgi:hypothetical protein